MAVSNNLGNILTSVIKIVRNEITIIQWANPLTIVANSQRETKSNR
jgi:hypothetical protein